MRLEDVTLNTFAPLVDQRFAVFNSEHELKLVSAEPSKHGRPGQRAPFSLVFRGPREPVFAQQQFALEHESLGRLDIFLVPVGQADDGVLYEAVFN